MAVYAIGDIQGCYDPLRRLLERIDFDAAVDRLWCVGDLVNRGPSNLAVLRFLKSLGNACVCVLGNHDLHLLGLAAGESPYRRDTLQDVLEATDRDELIFWLRGRPMLHLDEELGWCMVHAGLHPAWNLGEAAERARAVEDMLQSEFWGEFCTLLHSRLFPCMDPPDADWEQALFNAAVLTRSRYCTPEGCFNWHNRSGAAQAADEVPWYAVRPCAWLGQERIVYGHWAAHGLVRDQDHVLGLDTGCVWGGKLSAARLDGDWRNIIQTDCAACQSIGSC